VERYIHALLTLALDRSGQLDAKEGVSGAYCTAVWVGLKAGQETMKTNISCPCLELN
jgi:hypothetical protein